MKIGITCYPTFGGSGVVATELGHELARRGHDVHFITYAMPSRLNVFADRVTYHEVTVPSYPLFQYAPYDLALATRMGDVATHEGLDLIHVHYALPHAISAHLAREMLAPLRLGLVTTLHGTDVTIVGQDRSYLPITRFGIEKSDAVTAVSEHLRRVTLDVFQPRKEIEVVPNFIDPDRFSPESPQLSCRFVPAGPPASSCTSRTSGPSSASLDVVEIFDRVQRRVPASLVMVGDGPDRPAAEALCREKGIAGAGLVPREHARHRGAHAVRGPLPPPDGLRVVRPLCARGAGLRRAGPRVRGRRPARGRRARRDGVTSARSATSTASPRTAPRSSSTTRAIGRWRTRPRTRAVDLFNADAIVSRYLALYERVLAAA